MCHLELALLVIEATQKAVAVHDMISWLRLREYEITRTSMITATGGGTASNTSPVVAHVNGLPL
jgi:hypothetical protein